MQAIIKDELGQVKQVIELDNKTFKTGNTGYYGYGKVNINGTRYQASFSLARINNKKAKK